MALDVEIEQGGLGVLFVYRDVLEGAKAIAASKALYTPENLQKMHYQIADLRAVSRIELTTEQIRQLAEADRAAARQGNGFLIASVVDHDLQAGISRFYRTYAKDDAIEAAIFKTMPNARQWLTEKLQERGITVNFNQAFNSTPLDLESAV